MHRPTKQDISKSLVTFVRSSGYISGGAFNCTDPVAPATELDLSSSLLLLLIIHAIAQNVLETLVDAHYQLMCFVTKLISYNVQVLQLFLRYIHWLTSSHSPLSSVPRRTTN